MNDKTTQEGAAEDDIKVVEVDNIEAAHQAEEEAQRVADEAAKQAVKPEAHADDEDDDEDDRLAESQTDTDDEVANQRNRERRRSRREMQRRARERKDQELVQLAQQNQQLAQRLAQLEGAQLTSTAAGIESQYSAAQNEIARAEAVLAAAIEAGNGADTAAALRARDEARDRAIALRAQYGRVTQTLEQHRQPPQTQRPQAENRAATYGRAWIEANPWFDPNGTDEDSAITRAIDAQVSRDGYDPNTIEYWQEVTRRVNDRFEGPAKSTPKPATKQAPPTGTTREHVPASTRNEVYVTPERKQAMIDAGVWDDPAARARYLKAYRQYDNDVSARKS